MDLPKIEVADWLKQPCLYTCSTHVHVLHNHFALFKQILLHFMRRV